MKDTFLMIDGNSLLHRAFHALPLMDAGGVYTNAIYGFLTMMLKAISDENARYLAVCFDEHAPTFRHTAYPDYKAGRAATPDELRQQFATIRTLLPEMGIQVFSLQGWEADDLLGTLSKLGEDAGVSPVILTGDRDALQLVSDTTQVLFTRKGISETTHFTPAMVYEVYGFSPEQVVDWKGLAGDSSDNIPGIPGVGDKTAVRLLHQYGTLDNILAHAGEVKGKLGEKLVTWADQAKMCRELATIRRDAPIAFSLKACAMPDFRHGIPALEKLKLNSIIRRLQAPDDAPAPDTAAEETPLTLLPFADAAPISSGADLTAWLTALPDSAAVDALQNFAQQILDLAFHWAHHDDGVQQTGGADDLLGHAAGMFPFIGAGSSADKDRLADLGFKFLKFQRAVVKRRGQAEAIFHQRFFAAVVPAEHAADLRQHHMAFIHHQDKIFGEVVQQRGGGGAGGTAGQHGRVVLDALAHANFL